MAWHRHSIEPLHTATGRYYDTPLGRVPSVTTVLGRTAIRHEQDAWVRQVGISEARRRTAEAVARGRAFHLEMQEHLQRGIPGTSAFFRSVQPFVARIDAIQLVEGTVWHRDGFAGTVDCVASVNGVLSVIDWKTSSKKKPSDAVRDERLQVAAYRHAVQALYHVEVKQGFVVFALPDQQAHVLPLLDLDRLYEVFLQRLHAVPSQTTADPAALSD